MPGDGLLIKVLYVIIAAPVVEELLFRGIVLNRLNSWVPTWVAVLASGVLFGAMHLDLLQGIVSSISGVAFALVYMRYRNIWIPIAGHIAGNLAAITLEEISRATGGVYAVLLLAPGTLLFAICTWLLLKYTKPAVMIQELKSEEKVPLPICTE
jgi:membrane protease YdiL (CAAX protease family)